MMSTMIHHDFNMTPVLFPSIGIFVCKRPRRDVFHFGHAVVEIRISSYLVIRSTPKAETLPDDYMKIDTMALTLNSFWFQTKVSGDRVVHEIWCETSAPETSVSAPDALQKEKLGSCTWCLTMF